VPAPVVAGLGNFISSQLNVVYWEGEVPRTDVAGRPINPDAATSPSDWPVVKVFMREPGLRRTWTTEDPYDDAGEMLVQVWGVRRDQLEDPPVSPQPGTGLLNRIEALLAQASNWPQIALGGPPGNPYYVVSCLLRIWYCGQEEGVRTSKSELLYRGDLVYDVIIHGAVSTV
jgi:hypothetical protein